MREDKTYTDIEQNKQCGPCGNICAYTISARLALDLQNRSTGASPKGKAREAEREEEGGGRRRRRQGQRK